MKVLSTPLAPQTEKASMKPSSSSAAAKKAEGGDFADQLFGAKSGKLEGPDSRNERKVSSGRDVNREGDRSMGREKQDTRATADSSEPKKAEGKLEKKQVAAKKEAPKREPLSNDRPPTNNAEAQAPAPVEARPVAERSKTETTSETSPQVSASSANTPAAKPTAPAAASPAKSDVKLPDFFSKSALGGSAIAPMIPQDQTAVQADTTAQMLASMQDQEIMTRQAAMERFLTTMETELGVPPEKVLQAFSEMDLDSLGATPQNSVGAFVEGLDLEPAGQVRAAELYKELLDVRGETIIGEKFAAMGEDVKFDITSPRDIGLRKLDKSLTDLNHSFFRKDGLAQNPEKAQQALESMDAQIARLMRERSEKGAIRPEKSDSDLALMMAAGGAGAATANEAADGADFGKLMGDSGDSLSAMTMPAGDSGLPSMPEFGSDSNSMDMMNKGNQGQAQAQAAPVVTAQNSEFKQSVSREMKATDEKGSLRSEQALESSTLGSTPASAGQAAAPKTPLAAGAAAGPASMMMGRQPTAADEQQNVREMIKQAQVMLKRGGGEMKIEMTPEGMGQVQLKVAVENGQVNVQMLTESESAKRLLEKGLGDLKTSLAAQQLKVENVRVDVGQEIQKHMDQQAGQEQARNFAREFMQQQRDERQEMRQGAFAMRGIGSYGGQRRAPLEPETVSGASARTASARGAGRSLNLVA